MPTRRTSIVPEDIQRIIVPAQPRISPGGESVLYVRRHAGAKNANETNLWVVDVEGGSPRPLTSGGKDGHGRWSPDGKSIAFISNRTKGQPQLRMSSSVAEGHSILRNSSRLTSCVLSRNRWSNCDL